MSETSEDQSHSSQRSPVLAVTVVFAVLLIGYGIQLKSLFDQSKQLKQTHASLVAVQPQIAQLSTTLQAVSMKLMEISTNSPAAKKIVQDFAIQINPGPRR